MVERPEKMATPVCTTDYISWPFALKMRFDIYGAFVDLALRG